MLIRSAIAMLMLQASAPEAPATPATTAACSAEEFGEFDFWIGEWDVFPTGTETKVAESTIRRLSSGCAIHEHWQPLDGKDGTSISLRNHRSGRWEQLWIGSDGRRVDFEGGMVEGAMVMSGYWDDVGGAGKDALIRMRFTPNEDGSVRQSGEASSDHGANWTPFFDLTYRRKATTVSGDQP